MPNLNRFQTSFFARVVASLLIAATLIAPSAQARGTRAAYASGGADVAPSYSIPAAGSIEVAFSPNESSEALVCKAIDSAKHQIRGLAYSFTAPRVVERLLAAIHRGVDVKLVVDYKENISEDRSGRARAALSALATAGADVRTIAVYPIAHDKTFLIDGITAELGSYNYSEAAAHRNSENVFVNWNNPALVAVYLSHFQRNYAQSVPFKLGY